MRGALSSSSCILSSGACTRAVTRGDPGIHFNCLVERSETITNFLACFSLPTPPASSRAGTRDPESTLSLRTHEMGVLVLGRFPGWQSRTSPSVTDKRLSFRCLKTSLSSPAGTRDPESAFVIAKPRNGCGNLVPSQPSVCHPGPRAGIQSKVGAECNFITCFDESKLSRLC
jgi:hypothetical protein